MKLNRAHHATWRALLTERGIRMGVNAPSLNT